MKYVVYAFCIILIIVTSSYADNPRTVKIYKQHFRSTEHDQGNFDHHLHHMLYLSGVADAYAVLNQRRTASELAPLYCLPDDTELNGNDYTRILEQRLEGPDPPIADHWTVAEALLLSLQEEFPCE